MNDPFVISCNTVEVFELVFSSSFFAVIAGLFSWLVFIWFCEVFIGFFGFYLSTWLDGYSLGDFLARRLERAMARSKNSQVSNGGNQP